MEEVDLFLPQGRPIGQLLIPAPLHHIDLLIDPPHPTGLHIVQQLIIDLPIILKLALLTILQLGPIIILQADLTITQTPGLIITQQIDPTITPTPDPIITQPQDRLITRTPDLIIIQQIRGQIIILKQNQHITPQLGQIITQHRPLLGLLITPQIPIDLLIIQTQDLHIIRKPLLDQPIAHPQPPHLVGRHP